MNWFSPLSIFNALPQGGLQQFDTVSSSIFSWVGVALAHGTGLALLTWLIVKVFGRRIRPAIIGAMWTLVLLKFMIPLAPGWSFSLSSLTASAARVFYPPAANNRVVQAPTNDGPIEYIALIEPCAASPTCATASPATATGWPIATIVLSAYLCCVGVVLSRRLWLYCRMLRQIRTLPHADEPTRALVARICERMGVRRVPDVRLSDEAPAPFVLGAIRTRLILSPRQLDCPRESEAVILHEIAHLRRGDLIVRYVQFLAGTVFFFWPVVAWVNRRVDLARELACDDWALACGRLSAAEYARCLLRALGAGTSWARYHPAAMAANPHSVERRIEMILNGSGRMYKFGKPGLLALLVLPAWAAFVLSGAALAEDAAKPVTQTQANTCDKKVQVKVVTVNGDATAANADAQVRVFKMGDDAAMSNLKVKITGLNNGNVQVNGIANTIVADDSGAQSEAVLKFIGCAEGLNSAQFGKDHPTADADGNGEVSSTERSAYLIAVGMNSSAALLTQFPESDRNQDGQLNAVETARLMTGEIQFMRIKNEDAIVTEVSPKVIVLNKPIGDGNLETKKIFVQATANASTDANVANGESVNLQDVTIKLDNNSNMTWQASTSPSKWLLDNSSYVPSAIEVSRYLPTVEEASLAAFKDLHPEADTDKDGRVTTAERDAFMDAEMTGVRSKLLQRFPEADANGDGTLTEEELQAHFSTMSKSEAGAAKTGVWIAKDGDEKPVQVEVEPLEIKLETEGMQGPPDDAEMKLIIKAKGKDRC